MVEMTVDSGACNTIGPGEIGPKFPVYETESSLSGVEYVSASGGTVKNLGEKVIRGTTGDWNNFNLKMQVGDKVRKMLGAVCKITDAGNSVVFQPPPYPNYIYNWSSGKSTHMYRENGQYKVQLWMKNDSSGSEGSNSKPGIGSEVVLEANSVGESASSESQKAVAVADDSGTVGREPEGEDDDVPGMVDSSDDENKPVPATEWVEEVDEEDDSGDEDCSEFELMANEEDKKKKGFQRPEH